MFNSAAMFLERRCSSQLDIPTLWIEREDDEREALRWQQERARQREKERKRRIARHNRQRHSIPSAVQSQLGDSKEHSKLRRPDRLIATTSLSGVASMAEDPGGGDTATSTATPSTMALASTPLSPTVPTLGDTEEESTTHRAMALRDVDIIQFPILNPLMLKMKPRVQNPPKHQHSCPVESQNFDKMGTKTNMRHKSHHGFLDGVFPSLSRRNRFEQHEFGENGKENLKFDRICPLSLWLNIAALAVRAVRPAATAVVTAA